jgi:hypothetical protein
MTQEQTDLLFKDLSMRLPYGVKVLHGDIILPTGAMPNPCTGKIDIESVSKGGFKPILRSLSDLGDNELYTMEHFPDFIKTFIQNVYQGGVTVKEYMYLIENHYDVNLLIEKGMAIDVNTLETNPYK